MPTGDKVIFPLINQRVDKKDMDDMMVLLQETISRTVASLIGEGAGALTAIPNTWDSGADTVTFGACMLAYSRPRTGSSDANAFNFLEGGVVIHDPNRPAQNGNSYVTLGGLNTGHFWFKRNTVDADVDNRAHWPGANSGEVVQSTPTRNREYVNFAVTSSRSGAASVNEATGWGRFAYFQKLTLGGVTTLQVAPLSAFGDDRGSGGTAESLMGFYADASSRKWGLNRLARDVINTILQMKDTDVTTDVSSGALTANPNNTIWKNPPAIGLRQASAQISTLLQQLAAVQGQLTTLQQQQAQLISSLESTPIILGFIYARVEFDPYELTNRSYNYTLTVNTGTNSAGIGNNSFSAFLLDDLIILEPVVGNNVYAQLDIQIRPNTAFIDNIVATSSMRQDWVNDGDLDDPPRQVIDHNTLPSTVLISSIKFPKGPNTPRDPGDIPVGLSPPPLFSSDFILRVKISRPDGSTRPDAFTLAVYGRNVIPGLA
jgi:hypothetical protein